MIARVLRAVADTLDRPPPPEPRRPIRVTGPTIFESDPSRHDHRCEVALGLLDSDVLGFALIVCRRTTAGTAHVELDVTADDPFWPAISETASRLALEGDRVFRS